MSHNINERNPIEQLIDNAPLPRYAPSPVVDNAQIAEQTESIGRFRDSSEYQEALKSSGIRVNSTAKAALNEIKQIAIEVEDAITQLDAEFNFRNHKPTEQIYEFPLLPKHPEPHTHTWTELELKAIQKYGDVRAQHAYNNGRNEALEEAAFLIDTKIANYDAENGNTDPDTGTREYPGDGAEWVGQMYELAEEIRALK